MGTGPFPIVIHDRGSRLETQRQTELDFRASGAVMFRLDSGIANDSEWETFQADEKLEKIRRAVQCLSELMKETNRLFEIQSASDSAIDTGSKALEMVHDRQKFQEHYDPLLVLRKSIITLHELGMDLYEKVNDLPAVEAHRVHVSPKSPPPPSDSSRSRSPKRRRRQ